MSTYILVHGAWHGGWCWDKIVSLLEKNGHKAEAPDLPGHGKDIRPIPEISLDAYSDSVCRALDTQSEPVILVGHSMGGLVITQAAENRPDKIKTLVYLAALLLRNGEIPAEVEDTQSLLSANLIISEDQSSFAIRDDAIREALYGDCSDEDVARAKSLLVPQAMAPFLTPVKTSEENFGRVPRVYLECLQDRAISPSEQKRMYTVAPCDKVISMNNSHSPFFSAPEELAAYLTSL